MPITSAEITPATRVCANAGQVHRQVGDEAVILSLTRNNYYSLNHTGAKLWQLLQQPISVGELQRYLVEAFDVDAERAQTDLIHLLSDLLSEGLISLSSESNTER